MKNISGLIYYYSIDGTVYGPLSLTELLEKIDADTLVYREGIEWTNANGVEELKKFFVSPEIKIKMDLNKPKLKIEKELTDPAHIIDLQNGSSFEPLPMFSAPFSFKGRIRRTEYGLSIIIYIIIYALIVALIDSYSGFSVVFIPLIWFIWAQGAKRCHDRSASGWYQLIPFYALWMIFAEGDSFENEYGLSPKKISN
jgi:uncharacterized membrane protein YhaH (DUF805 family)